MLSYGILGTRRTQLPRHPTPAIDVGVRQGGSEKPLQRKFFLNNLEIKTERRKERVPRSLLPNVLRCRHFHRGSDSIAQMSCYWL